MKKTSHPGIIRLWHRFRCLIHCAKIPFVAPATTRPRYLSNSSPFASTSRRSLASCTNDNWIAAPASARLFFQSWFFSWRGCSSRAHGNASNFVTKVSSSTIFLLDSVVSSKHRFFDKERRKVRASSDSSDRHCG